jgi:hypothetical protein
MKLRIYPLNYPPNSDTVEVNLKKGTEIIDLQSDEYETVIICHELSDEVETDTETRKLVFVKEGIKSIQVLLDIWED